MVKIVKSNFLRDSVIKSVLNEYEIKSQEMSKDELTYGTEIIDPAYDPFQLDKLRDIVVCMIFVLLLNVKMQFSQVKK